MAMPKWSLTGTYFETCNCEVICPCYFFSPPTFEECRLLVAWHIDKGQFGGVGLDGLNVALAAHRPKMGKWSDMESGCFLYLDERATQAQKEVLTQIFSGKASGVPTLLVRVTSRLLGMKNTKMEYRQEGKKRSLQISDIAQAEVEAIAGQGGADVTFRPPNTLVTGQDLTVAMSKRLSYNEHDLEWEFSGRNGVYSTFTYQGP